jgi:hypothetical protein
MATLSYSVTEPALRSPVEEWQPHGKQSESTTEWWYLTALVYDTVGNAYFSVWCPFHFTGEKASPASAGLPGNRRAIAAMTGFTDYRDNFRIADFPAAVVNEADTWDPRTNALRSWTPGRSLLFSPRSVARCAWVVAFDLQRDSWHLTARALRECPLMR